jgi:hypothetical protein
MQFFIDKRCSDGTMVSNQAINTSLIGGSHTRSTSYSVSYCAKKSTNLPMEKPGNFIFVKIHQ